MSARNRKTLVRRYWSKVDKKGKDECWNWKGSIKTDTGYGQFVPYSSLSTKPLGAHRIAYELTHGPIPRWPKGVVMHTCDNKLCVNPSHLRLVTQVENINDT